MEHNPKYLQLQNIIHRNKENIEFEISLTKFNDAHIGIFLSTITYYILDRIITNRNFVKYHN